MIQLQLKREKDIAQRSQIGKVARLVQQRPVNTIAAKKPSCLQLQDCLALIALQMVPRVNFKPKSKYKKSYKPDNNNKIKCRKVE